MSGPGPIELPRRQMLIGDALERLRELPDGQIDCVVTSPPYFALRDYGQPGQLGSEPTIDDWAAALVGVAAELRRALRPTGSVWLNIGDGYSRHAREGAPKKSLLLGPQRLAIALQQDGWLVRNQIIWAKRNPMPSSVRDRLSCTHETVLLLTAQRDYFFDLDAIRDEPRTPPRPAGATSSAVYPPPSAVPYVASSPRVDLNQGLAALKASGQESHPLGRNPGDVWHLSTASYRGAHFATFPAQLIRRPILATCPERLCGACQRPWRRAPQRKGDRLLAIGPLRADCDCASGWRPGVVLDPFMGAGTVALVAEELGRDWIGIELNPAYAQLADRRLAAARDKRQSPAARGDEA